MSHRDNEEQKRQSINNLVERSTALAAGALEDLIEKATQRAVEGTLERLGIDTKNPLSAQQDFARLRAIRKLMDDEGFIADLAFMRRWRLGSERIADTGIKAFVRWVVVGILGIVVLLTKDWWLIHVKG